MEITDPNAVENLQPNPQVARLQKLAEMLRRQSNNGISTDRGQMVGGRFIAPTMAQTLVPMLQNLSANSAENRADRMQQGVTDAQTAAAQQWRSNLPLATAGPQQQGPTEDGSQMPAGPDIQPTRAAVLKATMAGLQNPQTAAAAALYNKSALSGIDAEDTRQFKAQERDLAAQQHTADLLARLESDAKISKQKSEDAKLSASERAAETKRHTEALIAIAHIAASAKTGAAEIAVTGKAKPEKQLPAAQLKAYEGNLTSIKNIDDAIKQVEANPDSFGVKFAASSIPGMAGVGNTASELLDPAGVPARAAVANIGSLKIHDRAGSATTASETPRLMPFVPQVHNDAKAIVQKLKEIKAEAIRRQDSIIELANNQGYKAPGKLSSADIVPHANEAALAAALDKYK